MVEGLPGGILGLGGLAVALKALQLARRAVNHPTEANGDVLRAFKTLEQDFEELAERVASQLGRISRLKRDILPVGKAGAAGPGAESVEAPTAAAPPLTRSQLLARSKRQRGSEFYGEEQELAGDGSR